LTSASCVEDGLSVGLSLSFSLTSVALSKSSSATWHTAGWASPKDEQWSRRCRGRVRFQDDGDEAVGEEDAEEDDEDEEDEEDEASSPV